MKKEDVKMAFDSANKEIKQDKQKEHDKQVEEVKLIIKKTLQEIDKLQEKKKDIDDKLRILKLDIDDLKEGKLDRIQERQEKDPLAKKVSIIIIKETIRERATPPPSPWYEPYTITWNKPSYPGLDNVVYCDSTTYNNDNNWVGYASYNGSSDMVPATFTLNNSVVKNNALGTYKLTKRIVHLR